MNLIGNIKYCSSKFQKMEKKDAIIHVGYELEINDDVKHQLIVSSGIGENMSKLMISKPIVAVIYNPFAQRLYFKAEENKQLQKNMKEWHAKQKRNDIFYGKGLYVDLTSRYLVIHGTIGPNHYWVTLIRGTAISPIQLKAKVSSGELGQEIVIERVVIPCKTYMAFNHKSL